jgi:hypothetical protein
VTDYEGVDMSNGSKTFDIGDILTVMTGSLVSPDGVDGIYKILNHLTGEDLMTHQLPRASREAEQILRERYPDLAAVEIPAWGFGPTDTADQRRATVMTWLDTIAETHGRTRAVLPLSAADHTVIDPIAEIKMMRPDLPMIVVGMDE